MEYKEIIYELRNHTAWIYLNRPKAMNSLSLRLVTELSDVLQKAQEDENIRVLVLSGKGKAFCTGADLTAVMASIKDPDLRGPDFLNHCESTFNCIRNFPKPVIAATNGMALAGGLELTMCCDLVIAAKSAKLGDAHSNFGVFPGAGGAAVLPKKIGITRAKYLLFTGDFITAEKMLEFGLVNKVVEDDELEASVQELADKLSQKSPLVLSRMKKVADQSMDQDQASALRNELLTLRDHLRSHDANEGINAFTEKRPPKFLGK